MADACGKGDTGGSWCRLVCNSTVQGGNCCGETRSDDGLSCTHRLHGRLQLRHAGFCGCCLLYNSRAGVYRACPFYGGAPEKTAAITSDHHRASETTTETSPDDEDDELP